MTPPAEKEVDRASRKLQEAPAQEYEVLGARRCTIKFDPKRDLEFALARELNFLMINNGPTEDGPYYITDSQGRLLVDPDTKQKQIYCGSTLSFLMPRTMATPTERNAHDRETILHYEPLFKIKGHQCLESKLIPTEDHRRAIPADKAIVGRILREVFHPINIPNETHLEHSLHVRLNSPYYKILYQAKSLGISVRLCYSEDGRCIIFKISYPDLEKSQPVTEQLECSGFPVSFSGVQAESAKEIALARLTHRLKQLIAKLKSQESKKPAFAAETVPIVT